MDRRPERSDVRIAVVGDHDPTNETHIATRDAMAHAAMALEVVAFVRWIPTTSLAGRTTDELGTFDGIVIAPGSPYASMQGALDAITYARTHRVPLLGTCGGFQHVVIEYGRRVLGLEQATHEEVDPDASCLMVSALACSLAGSSFEVTFVPGSRAASAYGAPSAVEQYYCRFGLAPEYVEPLAAGGLSISGTDQDGEPRIVELAGHPFFVGTLFVPQVSSTAERPHPLVRAFVEAAASRLRVPVRVEAGRLRTPRRKSAGR